jgi:uncharacterized lipoprotein YddW (UPF0748 family)
MKLLRKSVRKRENSGGKASPSIKRLGVVKGHRAVVRVAGGVVGRVVRRVAGHLTGKLPNRYNIKLVNRHTNIRESKGQAILLGLVLCIGNVVTLLPGSAVAFSENVPATFVSTTTPTLCSLEPQAIPLRPASPVSATTVIAGDTFADHEFRALWVLRSTLVSRPEIDRMLRKAREAGFNVLFVQVRGRGDAFYRSSLEPRAELLTNDDFDPLAYLVSEAHKSRFEVHVWLNTFLVWSAPWEPTNTSHVMVSHPDWVAVRSDGRSLSELSRGEIEAMGIEGVFLAPGNPNVREHIRAVVRELVKNYDVEGVHLDYVRYPDMNVSYDDGTRTEFMRRYGVDPVQIVNDKAGIIRLFGEKGLQDLGVLWEKWRISSVDALVDSVRCDMKALDPEAKLSAAVIADSRAAVTRHAQDWPSWLKRGILDFAVPMCYSASTRFVQNQVRDIRNLVGDERFYPGIAIYNQSPGRVVEKIRVLRNMGIRGFSLFCYDPERPRGFVLEELSRTVFADRTAPWQ